MNQRRLTKRQKRQLMIESQASNLQQNSQQKGLSLKQIKPMTKAQNEVFKAFETGQNLSLLGSAGTGKTMLALFLCMNAIVNGDCTQSKIIIVRSTVPTRDIGFLPGTEKEKIDSYSTPYRQILTELFGDESAYDKLSQKGIIEFESTSFLRGTTFKDAFVIIEECQNYSYVELKTALTRVGNNCRVILAGDTLQDDLTSERFNEQSGLPKVIKILERMNSLTTVIFTVYDIVRSGFCKEFLIAEHEMHCQKG